MRTKVLDFIGRHCSLGEHVGDRMKINIGIICPSEIAHRRFLPAVHANGNINFIGVGVNSINERYGSNLPGTTVIEEMLEIERSKANQMIKEFGGKIFNSYEEIITSNEIDAIYLPLPPALHYKWAQRALEMGKHVLLEKPATTNFSDTINLIKVAQNSGLALHENYMFTFHSQVEAIEKIIESGELGDIRLCRVSFGFPLRQKNDFRYVEQLGGGALIDAGGYTIKYASRILGNTAQIAYSNLNYITSYEVDMYGSGALINDNGMTVQVAFGMDNDYKCDLEVWGSKGTLQTGRVLTAPAGFCPKVIIKKNNEIEERTLKDDNSFENSIKYFLECIESPKTRYECYESIKTQARLVEEFLQKCSKKGTVIK